MHPLTCLLTAFVTFPWEQGCCWALWSCLWLPGPDFHTWWDKGGGPGVEMQWGFYQHIPTQVWEITQSSWWDPWGALSRARSWTRWAWWALSSSVYSMILWLMSIINNHPLRVQTMGSQPKGNEHHPIYPILHSALLILRAVCVCTERDILPAGTKCPHDHYCHWALLGLEMQWQSHLKGSPRGSSSGSWWCTAWAVHVPRGHTSISHLWGSSPSKLPQLPFICLRGNSAPEPSSGSLFLLTPQTMSLTPAPPSSLPSLPSICCLSCLLALWKLFLKA